MDPFDFTKLLFRRAQDFENDWKTKWWRGSEIAHLRVQIDNSALFIINDGRRLLPVRYGLSLSGGLLVSQCKTAKNSHPSNVRANWFWRHPPDDAKLVEAKLLGWL